MLWRMDENLPAVCLGLIIWKMKKMAKQEA